MAEQIKDLDNLKPIDHAVLAKPHTAVYKMHRYFARRPWSVFRALVEHYSNPGSIILDPFCGGGVTVVEGLRLKRKVIGVDLNPLATFITRMEVAPVDLDELRATFAAVEADCREEIERLYLTRCPGCGKEVPAEWFEWSKVVRCKECSKPVVLAEAEKPRQGNYKCTTPDCTAVTAPSSCERLPDRLVGVFVKCPECGHRGLKQPDAADVQTASQVNFGEYTHYIPEDDFPDGDRERDDALSAKGIKKFRDLFTPRNLLANAILKRSVAQASCTGVLRELLIFTFSASLRFTNNMVFRNPGWQGGKPIEWATHAYWLPNVFIEQNAFLAFQNRTRAVLRGKKWSKTEIAPVRESSDFESLTTGGDCWAFTCSSESLPIPDGSIDAIITDPPYGGNVQYAELSDFWTVWLEDLLGVPGLIDNKREAISTRHKGFPSQKDHRHYRDMLFLIFKECHRVLKPGRWMVMTFHHAKFGVWNAVHMAAHDAGFVLPQHDGMIYQPPIKQHKDTVHSRADGSMLGDFILSFQKVDEPPQFCQIEHAEIGGHIERLAGEAVLHHKRASLSTIYTKLIPWLVNNNLLDKIGEKELLPYLQRNFEEREGLWELKPDPDQALHEELKQYSLEHYKASYEKLEFVPIEARIEYLIRRLLYAPPGHATQDEILRQIYTNLINSNMAEVREIQRVLESIAQLAPLAPAGARRAKGGKKGRKVWRLKEDIERERLWREMGADVEYRLARREESDHDLAIARLVDLADLRKLKAHIGRTEQTKYTEFRRMSSPLPKRIQGLPKAARRIIEQIDVLWHNGGRGVVAAFEVERTSTITSGIDRFRNLLAVVPEPQMQLYIVVPKARGDEARRKIGSPANRKAGLHRRIGYVYLQDLQIRSRDPSVVKFEKITHYVGDK